MAKRKVSAKQRKHRAKFKKVMRKCKGMTGAKHKACVRKGLKK